jgi:hypothetical protein
VTGISLSTVTLGATADPNPPVAVPLTLTCTPAAGPAGACDPTAPYASIVAMPTSTLVPGQIYVFTLNPALAAPPIADAASNPLVLSTTSFRGPLNQEETSPAGRPKWASVNNASASGSNYAVAHLAGASAIFTFTGTAVTWNTVTGPSQGKASVYVDNVLKLSVNNYASAPHFHVARTVSGLSAGPHTLRVVVLGQKGLASATDCLVAVDSFTVASIVSEQSAASVSYAWSSVASPSASGGHYGIDDLANSKFSLNFVGTGVTWLTVTGPNMGEAQVLIDGVLKATVNNYAANATYKVARNYGSLTAGTHTITIVVLGKHVTTSSSNRIAVDALRVA